MSCTLSMDRARGFRGARTFAHQAVAAIIATGACGLLVVPARADIDPVSGIDFVHITDPGNAPWPGAGISGDRAVGRGSVGYDYNIGRMEVTTGQWVEFFNAAFDRPDPLPHLIPPTFWGAASTSPNTPRGAALDGARRQREHTRGEYLVADGGDVLQLAVQRQVNRSQRVPERRV